jgi:hypothetical protein
MTQINTQVCDQAPIHSLPDEILEVIFLINTSKLVVRNHCYDSHSTTLATSQVCQRWRAVALDYPVIWSRIINYERHTPFWIETLLARSGSGLIDVGGESASEYVILEHPGSKPIFQSIFQRNARLKTVNVYVLLFPWECIYQSFLRHPAPNLEVLYLLNSLTLYHSPSDCLYTDPLFADEAPCLRRLNLKNCVVDFSSSVLSNLTELSVRDVSRLSSAPSVAGWLRVLKNIPSLRFLTLIKAISYSTEHEPLPVVDLPHLALLKIMTGFYTGTSLIDHLNIPPLCGIELRLSYLDVGLDIPKQVLSFLSKQLTHWPQNCSDRYLQAAILNGGKIHFGNSRSVGKVPYMTESDDVELHSRFLKDPILLLVFALDLSERSFTFFSQLLEMYSSTVSTTTTLDLWVGEQFAGAATTSNGCFPAFLTSHPFTNVETLNMLHQSPLYLLPLFQRSSLPEDMLFPGLQSLHFTGICMERDGICSAVVAFLLRRAEAGIPLSEIKILGGTISDESEEILSRIGNLRISLPVHNPPGRIGWHI